MLFRAFRVVYTVKSWIIILNMDKVSKKQFGRITEYFCDKNLPSGFIQVSESFFDRCSWWRKQGWNSLYGRFSRKSAPMHTSTRSRARARPSTRFIRQHTNVSKEVCFWLWGKYNLVQLPEEPSVTWTVDAVCFFRSSNGVFSSVFVDERFINKSQFDAGFAHRLILKDGAVPAIKDPGHDSDLQTVHETASNVSVLLAIGAQVLVTL